MVRVVLSGGLKNACGGRSEFEVEAEQVGELLKRLGVDYPELKPLIDRGVAVAVDGQVYQRAWFKKVSPDSEVLILPRLPGG